MYFRSGFVEISEIIYFRKAHDIRSENQCLDLHRHNYVLAVISISILIFFVVVRGVRK